MTSREAIAKAEELGWDLKLRYVKVLSVYRDKDGGEHQVEVSVLSEGWYGGMIDKMNGVGRLFDELNANGMMEKSGL